PNSAAGVSMRRFSLGLNFGRSGRPCSIAYLPPASRIRTPLGLGPNSCRLVPSFAVTSTETSVQAPTSCSLRLFCWAAALPTRTASPSKVTVQILMILGRCIRLLPVLSYGGRAILLAHTSPHERPLVIQPPHPIYGRILDGPDPERSARHDKPVMKLPSACSPRQSSPHA